jgi:cytochrome c peroxidase
MLSATGCEKWSSRCADKDCLFTEHEWALVKSLAVPVEASSGRRIWDPQPDPDGEEPPYSVKLYDDPSNPVRLRDDACTDPLVQLGWKLYFDTRLSGPASWVDTQDRYAPSFRTQTPGVPVNISCATCHDPARYGADFTSQPGNVAIGAGRYDVNTQPTVNAAQYVVSDPNRLTGAHILYWNGRADALWAQAAQVIESRVSMNGDRNQIVAMVANDPEYSTIYAAAYPGQALPTQIPTTCSGASQGTGINTTGTGVKAAYVNLAKAIGAYEMMLTGADSPFDRFVDGTDDGQFSDSAKRGLKLFVGRASCVQCHNTKLFSDGNFHNVGVPQTGESVPTVASCSSPDPAAPPTAYGCSGKPSCDCSTTEKPACLPIGAFAGFQKLVAQTFKATHATATENVDAPDAGTPAAEPDGGAPETITISDRDKGAWRTASLRNVAETGPYMHDGAYASLADVVWHYDQGGVATGIGTPEIAPLLLTAQDRDDLVAFLQTLTSHTSSLRFPKLAKPPGAGSADGGASYPYECMEPPN